MTKRYILAAILGAVAMFIWSSIAHTALPLGDAGIAEIPNEAPVLLALQSALGQSNGLYMYPGFGLGPDATHSQKSAAMDQYVKKLAVNPSGILIYHPPGALGMTPALLITEFLTELVESFLVVFLLSMSTIKGFGARLCFVTTAGVMASITSNIPYWNWYGFPALYTASYMTIQIVGYICAGAAAAWVLGRGERKATNEELLARR